MLPHRLVLCRRTFDGEFTTTTNGVKQVRMMTQTFDKPENTVGVVRAKKDGLYDAVGLPYKGDVFRAVAVLPDPGVSMEAVLKDWATGQVGTRVCEQVPYGICVPV